MHNNWKNFPGGSSFSIRTFLGWAKRSKGNRKKHSQTPAAFAVVLVLIIHTNYPFYFKDKREGACNYQHLFIRFGRDKKNPTVSGGEQLKTQAFQAVTFEPSLIGLFAV